MSYLIVSLPGDEATMEADKLAQRVARKRTPRLYIAHPHPDHDEVRQVAADLQTILIFGHDGGGKLRATAGGLPWADAPQLASLFPGKRVYAFACNTVGEHSRGEVQGLGVEAVKQGVRLFAGHPTPVPPGPEGEGSEKLQEAIRDAMCAALVAFVDGIDDAAKLRRCAARSLRAVDWRFHSSGGAPMAIQNAMASLLVIPLPPSAT